MVDRQNQLIRALAAHRAGQVAAAEHVYRELLIEDASLHPAWHYLGVALLQQGRGAEALEALERAVTLCPSDSKYRNNLGNALSASGRTDEARASFELAAVLDPNSAEPLYNLGVIDQQAGRLGEAESAYRRVLAISPTHANALNNLGAVLQEQGKQDDALSHFESALAAHPDYSDALRNVASLYAVRGDRDAAHAAYSRLIAMRSDPLAEFRRALLLPMAYADRADVERTRRGFEDGVARFAATPLALNDPIRDGSRYPFLLAYQGYDDRAVVEQLAGIYRKAYPQLDFRAKHCDGAWRPGKRLRIGFLSRHFYNHTIGKLNRGLIARLPRDRFEVVALFAGETVDGLATAIDASADQAVRLPANLARAASAIAELKLDLLYYADVGMEPLTYFLSSMQLAPVQAVTWGHPVTSGWSTIDHFVSWRGAEPEGADAFYTERVAPFARMSTYYPRPDPVEAATRAALGLPEDRTVYFCAQTLFKIHPDMDEAFRNIVARDPRALLVFLDGTARPGLETRWRRQGLDGHFKFVPLMSEQRYRQMLAAADILIDTFPFSGGNTSLEGFAAGVPVVTLPGAFLRGRLTMAMYRQMGIEECIADSAADYAAKAVELASNRDAYRAVSRLISERNVELFDDAKVIDEFASFFENAIAEKMS